jgi:hypothetical protein
LSITPLLPLTCVHIHPPIHPSIQPSNVKETCIFSSVSFFYFPYSVANVLRHFSICFPKKCASRYFLHYMLCSQQIRV